MKLSSVDPLTLLCFYDSGILILTLLVFMHSCRTGTWERHGILCGDSFMQPGCDHFYLPGDDSVVVHSLQFSTQIVE